MGSSLDSTVGFDSRCRVQADISRGSGSNDASFRSDRVGFKQTMDLARWRQNAIPMSILQKTMESKSRQGISALPSLSPAGPSNASWKVICLLIAAESATFGPFFSRANVWPEAGTDGDVSLVTSSFSVTPMLASIFWFWSCATWHQKSPSRTSLEAWKLLGDWMLKEKIVFFIMRLIVVFVEKRANRSWFIIKVPSVVMEGFAVAEEDNVGESSLVQGFAGLRHFFPWRCARIVVNALIEWRNNGRA